MSESYITPRWFEIGETVDAWCIEAIDHVEDPGVSPVTSEFRDRTDKLLGWCREFHIAPKPIWETYCQASAARMPGGAFGPRRSQEYMEETYRGAILSCDFLRVCSGVPSGAENESTLRAEISDAENNDQTAQSGMTWKDAAKRMEELRAQSEPRTSQRGMSDKIGCSVGTVNKAISKTASLHAWAKPQAADAPKAQTY